MKKNLGCILALLSSVISLTVLGQGADSKSLIKDIDIKLRFSDTPRATFENFANPVTNTSFKWLIVEVNYSVPEILSKGTDTTPEWLDSVEMNIELLMPSSAGSKGVVLMTGKTVFWAIAMDGKKHKAEGFIPPHILRRYAKSDMKLTQDSLQTLFTSVTFISKGENIIGRHYATMKQGVDPKAVATIFAKVKEDLPPRAKLDETIYSRNNTPWAYVGFDNYELIKVDTGKR